MSFGKRQLILGAMVVALGTAVYLNWQFSGTGDITAADVSDEEKELGKAQLVNGTILEEDGSSDESLYAQEHPSDDREEVSSSENETDQPEKDTPSDSVSTAAEIEVSEETTTAEDYFTQAALNRQKTRDEAIESLQEILGKEDAAPDQIQQAVEESSAIAKNMLSESNIENLVKSKGYTDCVAFIQDDACSLVVGKPGDFTEEDAAVVKDIVVGQSNVSAEHIKIVDHNTEKN